MCCPCMIATISLTTDNKLNCFINARGMLTISWHCALVLLRCFVLVVWGFLHVIHFRLGDNCIKYVT